MRKEARSFLKNGEREETQSPRVPRHAWPLLGARPQVLGGPSLWE